MLLTEKVIIKWIPNTKKHYVEKGYIFTKIRDEFEIRAEDLSHGSSVKVTVRCDNDNCEKERKGITFVEYMKYINKNGKYYCNNCANKLIGKEKVIKTWINKGGSFYDWCYENLPKEIADKVISRWDNTLNKISPKDVSPKSAGINNKGYWFKCLDHPEHESEQKRINNFTRGELGSIECIKCNSIAETNPELIKYLVNKEDALNYSVGTKKKLLMKCPDCGFEKPITPRRFVKNGISCPKCSDGFYPERLLFNILEQLKLEFIPQLSKTTFSWCKNYKYDNYISKINCIIETHGLQHYKENKNWIISLKETQENDKQKELIARNNRITNYIILDCRKSELQWIRDSIINSELPRLLNFKEEDIDWLKAHEFALSSFVKKSCDIWLSGITNTLEIANQLKLNRVTITRYLKQGSLLGWCNYDPKKEQQINGILQGGQGSTKVICLTTGEIFDSQHEAGRVYNIKQSNLSKCCKHITKSCGKHPETKEKLGWMYYEEYKLINNT